MGPTLAPSTGLGSGGEDGGRPCVGHACACVCVRACVPTATQWWESTQPSPSKMHFIRRDNVINKYTFPVGVAGAVSRYWKTELQERWPLEKQILLGWRWWWSCQLSSVCQAEALTLSLASCGLGDIKWPGQPHLGPLPAPCSWPQEPI